MPLTRSVATVTILVALTTIIGAGYAVSNQAVTTAPSSITTDPSMTTVTVMQTESNSGVSTVTQTVTQIITRTATQVTTTTRTVTQTVSQTQTTTTQSVTQSTQSATTTQTTSAATPLNVTIAIGYNVVNYTLVPASGGMQPLYLGSHHDLFIPMNNVNWYTVSCGTPYRITGTLYSYNFSVSGPSYYGIGSLSGYTNSAFNEMPPTGPQILNFTTNVVAPTVNRDSMTASDMNFTTLFTAC